MRLIVGCVEDEPKEGKGRGSGDLVRSKSGKIEE